MQAPARAESEHVRIELLGTLEVRSLLRGSEEPD
jgi:hypothetical protein